MIFIYRGYYHKHTLQSERDLKAVPFGRSRMEEKQNEAQEKVIRVASQIDAGDHTYTLLFLG